MSRSANDLAQEHERREARQEHHTAEAGTQHLAKVWGRMVIYRGVGARTEIARQDDVFLDLTRPGLLIAYDRDWNATIYAMIPGWSVTFEPNREG